MLSRAVVGVMVILAAFVAAAGAQPQTCTTYGAYRCQVTTAVPRGLEVCDYVTTTQLAWRSFVVGSDPALPCGSGRSCTTVVVAGPNGNYNSAVCAQQTLPACTGNERRCVSSTQYQVCANSAWGVTTTCPNTAPLCTGNGVCSANPCPTATAANPCTAGTYQCQNSAANPGTGFCQCDNGQWVARPCAPGTRCYTTDPAIAPAGFQCR